MNNTKVAVIYSEKRNHLHYVNNDLALMEVFASLPKNFHTEFFVNTPILGAIEKNKQLIWFKNTHKSMRWGVNKYLEPDVVVCVGSPNFEWEKVIDGNYKKVFIYDSYEIPHKVLNWDVIIVPTKDDLQYFPKAVVAAVYNNKIFKPSEKPRKHFNKFYPQQVKNLELLMDIQNDSETIAMNNIPDVFYLSDFSSSFLNDLLNQSKITCILEKDNDIELALSSMACNVPVVTTNDLKASSFNGVYNSLATTPDIYFAIDNAFEFNSTFDLSQFTIEKYAKKLKDLL